ncbi:histidine utilization repressor [Sphingosinicella sp. LHD-64]|uniref:histidine utilization repressor n=1 Tax=Sphingosinicella sp. LHD-64 TaxID=3072139 RepID=UPI00280DC32E|nr:histidine utilization repressor [Sphingosinicella sp. LHD-64]MDQ8757389.1 histidine utilization repressor [Sphingosinicella sp. LHD-64]
MRNLDAGLASFASSPSAENGRKAGDEDRQGPPSPRYAAIKQFLTDAVRDGTLKPGDRVPSEAELVARFSVSRMTANRALRELQGTGLLVRRAGIGSFIAEPKPIGQMIEIRNIADEIRARGHAYRATVVHNAGEKATAETAALLEVSVGTHLFHSVIVHHEADLPIQLEERFVLASIAPDYGEMDFTQTTPNEYLTRMAPLERFEHRVTAAMPDARVRAMLGLGHAEPVLVMTRRTWSRARLVSHAWLTHPASRFELSAAFSVDR